MWKIFTTIVLCLYLIPTAFAAKADTNLKLEKIDEAGANILSLKIWLENPSQQKIIATQSWLKYDNKILKGKNIEVKDSAFDFVAPGENEFDQAKGLVKIGRSSTKGGVTESKALVAEVSFEILKNQNTKIEFYNFRLDNEGNTSVRVMEDGFPVNTLAKQPEFLSLNWGTSGSNLSSNNSGTKTEVKPKVKENLSANLLTEMRPQNFRVNSGDSYILMTWDKLPNMVGYNVYYSQRSGRYLQRRSVGDLSEFYLDGLKNGDTYYLAITAYDQKQRETDYSNEVKVTVGDPNSSSNPIGITKSQNFLANTPENVKSGPGALIWMIGILSVLFTFRVVIKRKKCYN
ncbi:MAG TPA: cohesin domain-containing protein [Candidatus Gracilibacteria bacterium]|nr:cohesin domain-containing protein [Candidatus Gracilibacteria bacterium]